MAATGNGLAGLASSKMAKPYGSLSKAAKKNAKRGQRRQAKLQEEQLAEVVRKAAAGDEAAAGDAAGAKVVRKVQKKLREIDSIKAKQAAGATLDKAQGCKLAAEAELRAGTYKFEQEDAAAAAAASKKRKALQNPAPDPDSNSSAKKRKRKEEAKEAAKTAATEADVGSAPAVTAAATAAMTAGATTAGGGRRAKRSRAAAPPPPRKEGSFVVDTHGDLLLSKEAALAQVPTPVAAALQELPGLTKTAAVAAASPQSSGFVGMNRKERRAALQKKAAEEGVGEKTKAAEPTTGSAAVAVEKESAADDVGEAERKAARRAARKAAKLAEEEKAAAKTETQKTERTAVPKVVRPGQMGLDEFLVGLNLEKYAVQLRDELGAAVAGDLKDLENEDMDELGLKKLEKKRLVRALMEL
jgi:hypothetical protein